jgi:hypothetical protein
MRSTNLPYETVFQVKARKETKQLIDKLLFKVADERGCLIPRATAFEALIAKIAKQEAISL